MRPLAAGPTIFIVLSYMYEKSELFYKVAHFKITLLHSFILQYIVCKSEHFKEYLCIQSRYDKYMVQRVYTVVARAQLVMESVGLVCWW